MPTLPPRPGGPFGSPADELAPTLDWLAAAKLVEHRPDPQRHGIGRLMLSAVAVVAARLALALAPTGAPAARGCRRADGH